MPETSCSAQISRPLITDLDRLSLPSPLSVPEVVVKHREENPVLDLGALSFSRDASQWNRIDLSQREALVHVISRFARGMEVAKDAIPMLSLAARRAGRKNAAIYSNIQNDMDCIGRECRRYLREVALTWELDSQAVKSSNFVAIFDTKLRSHIEKLKSLLEADDNPQLAKSRIMAESKLRVDLHLIAEGLGGITGVWGLNAAIRELRGNSNNEGVELPDLAALIGSITLVLRRNIAFGLSEWRELAKGSWWATMRSAVAEFREVKPSLNGMRKETFTRWEKFPFESINEDILAEVGRRRVFNWVGNYLLLAGVFRGEIKVANLEDIL
jgi:hypothetical protein